MGWVEDKAAAEAGAVEPEFDSACPKCGASGDDPCLTKAGKEAKNRHKERS